MTGHPGMSEAADLAEAIRSHLREGRLPCAQAFALARRWGREPIQVAAAAERLGVRIGWCQLGLFEGEKRHGKRPQTPAAEVSLELQEAIRAELQDGRLPCARAWAIARRLGLGRLDLGQAADALKVPISRCQLGCFP